LGPAHRRLSAIGAIAPDDGDRFRLLGVPGSRVQITGDSRFDQVSTRAAAVDRSSGLIAELLRTPRNWIVAGSTWPEDEDRIIASFRALGGQSSFDGLIIAPHEPTAENVDRLERRFQESGFVPMRLAHLEAGGILPQAAAAVIIVDRVGILGDLYAVAEVAYVGGGFGSAGLHSVLEPAAYGVPVVFGPAHGNAREAAELILAGGAIEVGDREALTAALRYLSTAARRAEAGAAAKRYVQGKTGAAERNARLILEVLGRSEGQ
jgi:3-deoxy-D-manno-octulosonic-acid transferase